MNAHYTLGDYMMAPVVGGWYGPFHMLTVLSQPEPPDVGQLDAHSRNCMIPKKIPSVELAAACQKKKPRR
jgi:hypothetical protein